MSLAVPVIETARLVLREPREADLDAVAAFMASDRARFVGGPVGRFDAWRGLLGSVGHWALRGYGYWTVEERGTGAIVGRTGVVHHAVDWPEPELGWHVYDGFEGRGYAFEAAEAARAATAERFGIDRVISLIDPGNARSQALARRLGAAPEGEITFMGEATQVWRHPAVAA